MAKQIKDDKGNVYVMKKPFYKRWWFILIVIILLLGFLASKLGNEKKDSASAPAQATETKKQDEPKAEPALDISAADLAKAYEDNEVNADKQYKDKMVNVTGKIVDISVVLGNTAVTLSDGKDFSLNLVHCSFKDQAEIDKVAKLKKGETITINGKVEGKSVSVVINDSKIVAK